MKYGKYKTFSNIMKDDKFNFLEHLRYMEKCLKSLLGIKSVKSIYFKEEDLILFYLAFLQGCRSAAEMSKNEKENLLRKRTS
jgi:hypothetical protein